MATLSPPSSPLLSPSLDADAGERLDDDTPLDADAHGPNDDTPDDTGAAAAKKSNLEDVKDESDQRNRAYARMAAAEALARTSLTPRKPRTSRDRYRKTMVSFLNFTWNQAEDFDDDPDFVRVDLSGITDQDVYYYLANVGYGKRVPSEHDSPVVNSRGSLVERKKAISHYLTKNYMKRAGDGPVGKIKKLTRGKRDDIYSIGWDEAKQSGNPTKSVLVRKLLRMIDKKCGDDAKNGGDDLKRKMSVDGYGCEDASSAEEEETSPASRDERNKRPRLSETNNSRHRGGVPLPARRNTNGLSDSAMLPHALARMNHLQNNTNSILSQLASGTSALVLELSQIRLMMEMKADTEKCENSGGEGGESREAELVRETNAVRKELMQCRAELAQTRRVQSGLSLPQPPYRTNEPNGAEEHEMREYLEWRRLKREQQELTDIDNYTRKGVDAGTPQERTPQSKKELMAKRIGYTRSKVNVKGTTTLSNNPRTLETLWEEYVRGVDGRKPAILFTITERNFKSVNSMYRRRRVVWKAIEASLKQPRADGEGRMFDSAEEVIEALYDRYGRDIPLGRLMENLARERKEKGNNLEIWSPFQFQDMNYDDDAANVDEKPTIKDEHEEDVNEEEHEDQGYDSNDGNEDDDEDGDAEMEETREENTLQIGAML